MRSAPLPMQEEDRHWNFSVILKNECFITCSLFIEFQQFVGQNLRPCGKEAVKDQMTNRSAFRDGGLPENTRVCYYKSSGKILLEGQQKGRGIVCYSCNCQVSASQLKLLLAWTPAKEKKKNQPFFQSLPRFYFWQAMVRIKACGFSPAYSLG